MYTQEIVIQSGAKKKRPQITSIQGRLLVVRDLVTQLDRTNGCGARAFLALPHLVIHRLTLLETVKGSALDLGVVEEQFVSIPLDESEFPL